MSGPVAETRAGKLRGVIELSILGRSICAFRGIPYAKPPVGELRFQDPLPAEPWTDVRDATDFGPMCAQPNFLTAAIEGSDDCLYLNVYAQSFEPHKRRPVMFWIHGGGFNSGSGDDLLYGPDYLLRKDIVLVTINYRVGVLGFLNLEDEIAPGNQGLKDQVLALKWVRDNIAFFGGDPDNVTIFGESAGGASVHYLCVSSLARGLFHKAISQSGVISNPWAYMSLNPKRFAYKMCELLENKTEDHKTIVEFLKTVDSLKLIEIQEKLLTIEEKLEFIFPFGPGIDDKSKNPFMPIHPETAAEEGVQLPLLIGHTDREGQHLESFNSDFVTLLHPTTIELLRKYNLTPGDLKYLYCKNDPLSKDDVRLIDLLGDVYFVEGIHRVVKTQVEKSCAPTYLYQFSYDKSISLFKSMGKSSIKGASHADELPYLFREKILERLCIEPLKQGTTDYRLMERMTDLWTNFAKTGRPTPTTSELVPFYWQPVNSKTVFRYLDIDEELRMKVCLNLEQHFTAHSDVKKL